MNEQDLKHVVALLLEDAKRLQQIEPNASTEAHIFLTKKGIKDLRLRGARPARINLMTHTITPFAMQWRWGEPCLSRHNG